MGWADCGTDSQGRPIGYAFNGTCDHEGCHVRIDRGLSYVCGVMHGEDEISCEKYFCERHKTVIDLNPRDASRHGITCVGVCEQCSAFYEKFYPEMFTEEIA